MLYKCEDGYFKFSLAEIEINKKGEARPVRWHRKTKGSATGLNPQIAMVPHMSPGKPPSSRGVTFFVYNYSTGKKALCHLHYVVDVRTRVMNRTCRRLFCQKFYFSEQLQGDGDMKPNSWMYNFIEVSGHNLESFQTWGFFTDFLNRKGKGVWFFIRFSSFLLYSTVHSNWTVETVRGCVSLKK